MKKYSKGFTLIELLVVIAIIGILSSVVLASLNTARTKGSDTAAKAGMAELRSQGELYYDVGSTYGDGGTCGTDGSGATMVFASSSAILANINTNATVSTLACNSTANQWAVSVKLKSGTYWCVDSSGASKTTTGAESGGACGS